MKTLINKANPQIRITAPEITLENHCYYIWTDDGDCIIEFWEKDWTLVEEEPEKIYYKMLDNNDNCPFDKGNCNYCTVQFCGARKNVTTITTSTSLPVVEEKPVDFEKLALEKYPETMTYDSRGLYDRKKYDRDIYKQGLKDGYNLKHKIRNDDNNL